MARSFCASQSKAGSLIISPRCEIISQLSASSCHLWSETVRAHTIPVEFVMEKTHLNLHKRSDVQVLVSIGLDGGM